VDLCRRIGAQPIFLLPVYWNSKPHPDDLVRQVAARTNTPMIDLPKALYESGKFSEAWYGLEELGGHPNALGHRLIGEAIAADLPSHLR